MTLSNNMKTTLVGLLVVIVLAVSYFTYPMLFPPSAGFEKGNEVNSATFSEILNDADNIYIVTDLRDVSSAKIRTSMMQCGIDFAGSYGLVNRNVKYVSLDPEEKCVIGSISGDNGVKEINECLAMLNNGVSLYIIEGDHTTYYAKAAMVGVNESYVMGMCSVGEVSLSNY